MRGLASYSEVLEVLDGLPVAVREARRLRGLTLRATADAAGVHSTRSAGSNAASATSSWRMPSR